jgi:hypothetical protein
MTSTPSVDGLEGPWLGAWLFAHDEFGQLGLSALDPSALFLPINHPLSIPHPPANEIVALSSPSLLRPAGPWLPPLTGIVGQPPSFNNSLFGFDAQDFFHGCPGLVPGLDHGLLVPEVEMTVAEGSEQLLGMPLVMPDHALSQSSPGASDISLLAGSASSPSTVPALQSFESPSLVPVPVVVAVGGPSTPPGSASEHEAFVQAILHAANVLNDDVNISQGSQDGVEEDHPRPVDVVDVRGDELDWEDVHDVTIIRGKFVSCPVNVLCQHLS